VVSDIEAARAELIGRGAGVGEAFHFKGLGGPPVSGPAPNGGSYVTIASFSDPDGNSWLLQEIKTRLPGRGLGSLDVATLTELLRETEKHHGYEPPPETPLVRAAAYPSRASAETPGRSGQRRHEPSKAPANLRRRRGSHATRHRSRRSVS
jgi:hypothetical protein